MSFNGATEKDVDHGRDMDSNKWKKREKKTWEMSDATCAVSFLSYLPRKTNVTYSIRY